MINVDHASVSAKEKLVVCDSYRCEKGTDLVDRRHIFTSLVQNEHFSIFT